MRARVVTVSDRVSAGESIDLSGPEAARILEGLGFELDGVDVVPDGIESVAGALRRAVADGVRLIVTTGGTGVGPRDLTPEATAEVIERFVPGLGESMRAATFGRNPHGLLSRGMAGTVGRTLIINLPGSPRGVTEGLEVIGAALGHAVELVSGEESDHNASDQG